MYDVLSYSTCIQIVPLIFHSWYINIKGITCGEMGIKKWLSPTTCHYQIFDENQTPVDMHTSIMCINIKQNIKAVAPKL